MSSVLLNQRRVCIEIAHCPGHYRRSGVFDLALGGQSSNRRHYHPGVLALVASPGAFVYSTEKHAHTRLVADDYSQHAYPSVAVSTRHGKWDQI